MKSDIYIQLKFFCSSSNLALAVILTRAGLGLDQDAIRKRLGAIMSLALFPTLGITIFITITARSMLDFPWLFSAALGCVLPCFMYSRASAFFYR